MYTIASLATDVSVAARPVEPLVRWHPLTRIAFRLCALYFTLYVITTQMFSSLFVLPWVDIPPPGRSEWLNTALSWVATRVLGFQEPLVRISGSGDKALDYAHVALTLAVSVLLTLVWSIADARRPAYPGLQKWFRVFLRFALGGTLVSYGVVKVYPLQMSYPNLMRLLEPYGHFSPMGVLWASIGASPAYERFTGIVELSGAILLFIPGLTLLGALLSAAAMFQVFMLNMTYDVPVKLFSFHLVLMALVLVAPDAKRLFRFLVLNRPVPPSAHPPLARNAVLRAIAIVLQLLAGAWMVYSGLSFASAQYAVRGPNAPKPPLYGIWDVATMTIDGQTRSPLITDYDRWRRVVIWNPAGMSFQRMDDTFSAYGVKVDVASRTIALTTGGPGPATPTATPKPAGRLTFDQPSPDRLVLTGEMDGRKVQMDLRSYDRANFRLVQGKFRWLQEIPFNR